MTTYSMLWHRAHSRISFLNVILHSKNFKKMTSRLDPKNTILKRKLKSVVPAKFSGTFLKVMQTLKTVFVTDIITCFLSSAMLPVMSVIQQSISDSTKVRTRKQPIAGHQSTAIKAQNCFYFKIKATSLIEKNIRTKQRQRTRWGKK